VAGVTAGRCARGDTSNVIPWPVVRRG